MAAMNTSTAPADAWTAVLHAAGAHGFDERAVFTAALAGVHVTVYWAASFFYWAIVPRIPGSKRWRLEQGAPPPEPELVRRCVMENAFKHVFIQPVLLWLLYPYMADLVDVGGAMPGLVVMAQQILVNMVIEDFLFYSFHRMLHHPAIYRHVHKKHHEFKQNVGFCGEYFHPVEEILNTVPTFAGPLLQGAHVTTITVWLAIRVSELVDAHSGYALPFSPWELFPFQGGAARHEFHHSHNIGSFGSFFNFWDYILGTDTAFRTWLREQEEEKRAQKVQ